MGRVLKPRQSPQDIKKFKAELYRTPHYSYYFLELLPGNIRPSAKLIPNLPADRYIPRRTQRVGMCILTFTRSWPEPKLKQQETTPAGKTDNVLPCVYMHELKLYQLSWESSCPTIFRYIVQPEKQWFMFGLILCSLCLLIGSWGIGEVPVHVEVWEAGDGGGCGGPNED